MRGRDDNDEVRIINDAKHREVEMVLKGLSTKISFNSFNRRNVKALPHSICL